MAELLTTEVVAARLKVSPGRVRQLLSAGILTGQRLGLGWIVDADSLQKHVETRATPGNPNWVKRSNSSDTNDLPGNKK